MDKNTITGILLLGLLFLGFMYFSPKQEPQQSEQQAATNEQQTSNAVQQTDSLTADELKWLKTNIRDNGIASADSAGGIHLQQPGLNLSLNGEIISGNITVDGKTYDVQDVLAANTEKINVSEQRAAVDMLRNSITQLGKYGMFSRFLTGKNQVLKLENDVLSLQLASKSGTITRAELKDYDSEYNPDEKDNTKHPVVLFENGSDQMNFIINVPQPLNTQDFYFTPTQVNDSTVVMKLDLGPNAYWGLQYTLPKGDSYIVRIAVVQKGLDKVLHSNNPTMGVEWSQKIRRQEKGFMFEERNSGVYYKFAGGDVENLSESGDDNEERQAKIKWIGFKNQFFSSVLIARKNFNMADFSSEALDRGNIYLKNVSAAADISDYSWVNPNPVNFDLYLGPNLYPMLSDLDKTVQADEDLEMTRLIPLGWWIFRYINTWVVIPVFTFLGSFIGNYGIIILILTLLIKLVLFPLTYKSYKSQAVMRILAPDIAAINEKYPGQENALKRQQKTMELYSRAGASPMSGCLPMLLQMPILFAMFVFFPSCIELRGQSFLWAHDLSAPDAIISWSGNIPLITQYFGNHISLFCLLMTATNIIYTYTTMQSQSSSMPGMKWMMYLMPVFFMIFFNNYASALSYYYFLSLLITIMQNYVIRKFVIKEEKVRKTMAENAKKPKKKSGFMARLEEAQRQQQAMLKAQQAKNNGKGRR